MPVSANQYDISCSPSPIRVGVFMAREGFEQIKLLLTLISANGIVSLNGEMSERFKELVLKTSDTERYREFESHTLRQEKSTSLEVLFSVIFAFGELYCFAVIFELRSSYIRFASFGSEYNITSAQQKYHYAVRHNITLFVGTEYH